MNIPMMYEPDRENEAEFMEDDLDYTAIGRQIRKARRERQLTQEQVADAINISYGYMSNIETGKSNVGLQTLVRIAKFLQVSMDRLLQENLHSDDALVAESEMNLLMAGMETSSKYMALDLVKALKESTAKYGKTPSIPSDENE